MSEMTSKKDLEGWDAYWYYKKVLEDAASWNGDDVITIKEHTVDKNGAHKEKEVVVLNPAKEALLNSVQMALNAANEYRKAKNDEAKIEVDAKRVQVEEIAAKNVTPIWLELIKLTVPVVAELGGLWACIKGKYWLEQHDSWDDGNVLTDWMKSTFKRKK